MSTNKLIGIVLIVIGAVLLYFGWQGTESLAGEVQQSFTGRFSDETMLYLIGGGISLVIGIVMLARKG